MTVRNDRLALGYQWWTPEEYRKAAAGSNHLMLQHDIAIRAARANCAAQVCCGAAAAAPRRTHDGAAVCAAAGRDHVRRAIALVLGWLRKV
jgi:hypothetical protein